MKMYKIFELTAREEDVYVSLNEFKKEYIVGSEGTWKMTQDIVDVVATIKEEKENFIKRNEQYKRKKIVKDEITEFCANLTEYHKDGRVSKSVFYIKAVEVNVPIK